MSLLLLYREFIKKCLFFFSASAFVSLEGLSPFTWYVISVQSHSVSTTGPFGKPVIVQTKEGSKLNAKPVLLHLYTCIVLRG